MAALERLEDRLPHQPRARVAVNQHQRFTDSPATHAVTAVCAHQQSLSAPFARNQIRGRDDRALVSAAGARRTVSLRRDPQDVLSGEPRHRTTLFLVDKEQRGPRLPLLSISTSLDAVSARRLLAGETRRSDQSRFADAVSPSKHTSACSMGFRPIELTV